MNRDLTNIIRYFMDEWIPAAIRDSRWFMYPFYYIAYRGKNLREVMDFKSRVHAFTPEDYDRFYNNLDTISRNRATDLNKPGLAYILKNIDPSAETLIDVGSGNGFLLRKIHERHPKLKLTGFDIKDTDENAEGIYNYVKGNIEQMPFPDKSFDIVTCSHTVEHLPKLAQCLAELIRIARKQIFIVTPCQRYFYYTLDEHVNFFPFKEKLVSEIPLKNYACEKLNGDWVYEGKIS
ncbi:MAG TPA: methyltransferase domain-containing protein [Bacteroidia bacterium]|nr:methyltransferase domain-containing protein [Bacteroidia bacterium]